MLCWCEGGDESIFLKHLPSRYEKARGEGIIDYYVLYWEITQNHPPEQNPKSHVWKPQNTEIEFLFNKHSQDIWETENRERRGSRHQKQSKVVNQTFQSSMLYVRHPTAFNIINPYPTAFPYGNGMVLHFYQQQESSTTKTVHKVINKGLKTYV